jgi:CBS domain-containing protein
MSKISEVMTSELATCSVDATVAEVAALMRDRDIGDVLVVDNGKLRGIVTDRDLALQTLTDDYDPQDTPVRKFMSTNVVTGDASWSLEHAAKTMAKYQIRRLPIVDKEQLVGILSLGDIARFEQRKAVVSNSLQAVSTPSAIMVPSTAKRARAVVGVLVAAMVTALMVWLRWSETGQRVTQQVVTSQPYHSAKQAVGVARDKVMDAANNQSLRDLGNQMLSFFQELTA